MAYVSHPTLLGDQLRIELGDETRFPPKGQVLVILSEDQKMATIYEVTGNQGESRLMIGHVISDQNQLRRKPASTG